ncbi:hypothetical protein TrVE_jg9281 [Triparma verrucosa]|uniref:C3H1-type domain-containing protein n=1 Tax=Triparma verrucosa TaxID=1606542 RepID=A0A9W7BS95_9STRA|nr:hypothetical protein TrVE_jg9281 [Triparma verrucosa]
MPPATASPLPPRVPASAAPKPDAPLPPTYVNKTGFKAVVPPGLKKSFVICLGDDPEDIKKWREERRKKWPSRANVAEKLKAGIVPSPSKPASTDNRRTCNYFLKNGKCSKGDSCTFKHDEEAHNEYKRVGEKRIKDRADQLESFGSLPKKTRKEGILDKLLEAEEKDEEATTLAIIRYLVGVDFLQPQSISKSSNTDNTANNEKDEHV